MVGRFLYRAFVPVGKQLNGLVLSASVTGAFMAHDFSKQVMSG